MSNSIPDPDPDPQGQGSGFNSHNCVDLVFDAVEWDLTRRPLRPSLLKVELARREQLARLRAQMEQEKAAEKPPEQQGEANGN